MPSLSLLFPPDETSLLPQPYVGDMCQDLEQQGAGIPKGREWKEAPLYPTVLGGEIFLLSLLLFSTAGLAEGRVIGNQEQGFRRGPQKESVSKRRRHLPR